MTFDLSIVYELPGSAIFVVLIVELQTCRCSAKSTQLIKKHSHNILPVTLTNMDRVASLLYSGVICSRSTNKNHPLTQIEHVTHKLAQLKRLTNTKFILAKITHPSTNRVRRRATKLIETDVLNLPLIQTIAPTWTTGQ